MTKKFEFENLKIPQNGLFPKTLFFTTKKVFCKKIFWSWKVVLWEKAILGDFQIFKFFVIFGFPSKKFFFVKANILLSYMNKFWADIINREEDKRKWTVNVIDLFQKNRFVRFVRCFLCWNWATSDWFHFGLPDPKKKHIARISQTRTSPLVTLGVGINTHILLRKKHRHLSLWNHLYLSTPFIVFLYFITPPPLRTKKHLNSSELFLKMLDFLFGFRDFTR